MQIFAEGIEGGLRESIGIYVADAAQIRCARARDAFPVVSECPDESLGPSINECFQSVPTGRSVWCRWEWSSISTLRVRECRLNHVKHETGTRKYLKRIFRQAKLAMAYLRWSNARGSPELRKS